MNPDPLQQFAEQLHAWISIELDKKSGPFRSAELLPPLLGKTGSISPPVVFWINRESHLAGGVILLPKDTPSEITESGREICAALGLESYYTWGLGEVSAWSVGTAPGRLWSEPIPDTAMRETNTFREVLTLLLQDMQNRFFRDQPLLPKLSSHYLTNLLHNCIESSLLISSTTKSSAIDRSTITCVILRMLALFCQSSFPGKTSPDSLISDLQKETGRLPPALFTALSLDENPSPLSGAVTIKLHHLYQRLQQLGPEISPFLAGTITRLLQFWSETADLSPLPAPIKKGKSTLIINPDRYHAEMSVSLEIAAPPFAAATALLRFLQSPDRRHPCQQADLLDLKKPIIVDEVIGNLKDSSRPTANEQSQLNTLLRHSWPNRHLKLTSTAPRWAWRAIHLVGLLQGAPHGVLNLPADWLWAPYGQQFFNLISERVEINRVTPVDENQVRIEFNRTARNQQLTIDSFDNDVRSIDKQKQDINRTDLLLALTVPTGVYDLLRNGELKTARQLTHSLDAVELFLRSSLGRGLWQILSPNKQLPKAEKLAAEIVRTSLPLPGEKILNALARLKTKQSQPDRAMIDRELEAWLGSACTSMLHPRFIPKIVKTAPPFESMPAEAIADNLIKTGAVPLFPVNYLYDIPERSRRSYSVSGLLSIRETFFNSVTMQTDLGDILTVEGGATARALELISTIQVGKFDLPCDEHHVEIILNRYLHDLQRLYAQIQLQAEQPDSHITKEMVEQIWNRLPVPPQCKLDGH